MNTEYKQTEIGRIPKDWEVVRLISLVENKSDIVAGPFGSNLKVCDYRPYGVPIIRLQNIERNRFVDRDIKHISHEKADELRYHSYRPGDIVLAKLGDPIGKTCIVPSYVEAGVVVADVVRIRPSPRKAKTLFLEYVLNSSICSYQLRKQTIGSTRPRVNISQVRKLKIPLPQLDEQQRIAEVLSGVNDAIQRVDEAIAKTERLKKGLMQKLLTEGIGHKEFKGTKIGKIAKPWKVVKLKDVAEINRKSRNLGKDAPNMRFFYIDIDSVERETGQIGEPKEIVGKDAPLRARRVVHKDDIIMSTVRPYLKAFAVIPKEYDNQICSTGFAVLTCKKDVMPHYLLYSLFSDTVINQCNRMMVGAQYPALNVSHVSRIKIALPSIEEQQEIATILSTVDHKLELDRKRRRKLERVKKGLMNDLLTGKKRVKVAVKNAYVH